MRILKALMQWTLNQAALVVGWVLPSGLHRLLAPKDKCTAMGKRHPARFVFIAVEKRQRV